MAEPAVEHEATCGTAVEENTHTAENNKLSKSKKAMKRAFCEADQTLSSAYYKIELAKFVQCHAGQQIAALQEQRIAELDTRVTALEKREKELCERLADGDEAVKDRKDKKKPESSGNNEKVATDVDAAPAPVQSVSEEGLATTSTSGYTITQVTQDPANSMPGETFAKSRAVPQTPTAASMPKLLEPTPGMLALQTARTLKGSEEAPHPDNIKAPNPGNGHAVLAYDRDFLLQFEKAFKEKPSVDFDQKAVWVHHAHKEFYCDREGCICRIDQRTRPRRLFR